MSENKAPENQGKTITDVRHRIERLKRLSAHFNPKDDLSYLKTGDMDCDFMLKAYDKLEQKCAELEKTVTLLRDHKKEDSTFIIALQQKVSAYVRALLWIKEDIKCDRKEDVIIRYVDEVLERYGK